MSLHEKVETNLGVMIVLTILVVAIGGAVQIIPHLQPNIPATTPIAGLKPYNAMVLTGRDIYIREGCSYCHTQMVRPLRAETERYGHFSVAGESVYERPFLWGSKRTGPDLARLAGKYSDEWHRIHLTNPRAVVTNSIMPAYPWLKTTKLDPASIQPKMRVLKKLGHPYSEQEIKDAPKMLEGKTELDAMVAYLQSLGKHLSRKDLRKTINQKRGR